MADGCTRCRVGTVTDHYGDSSDSPAWIETVKPDGTQTSVTYVAGIDGNLGATIDQDGTLRLKLSNLHGDTIATCAPTATSLSGYSESTEYGLPRSPAGAADDYGWLGGKQRSTDDLGGLTLMGVRLYNPTTGRFLSVDPVAGGNENTYTYPLDPLDGFDLSGQIGCGIFKKACHVVNSGVKKVKKTVKSVAGYTVEAVKGASAGAGNGGVAGAVVGCVGGGVIGGVASDGVGVLAGCSAGAKGGSKVGSAIGSVVGAIKGVKKKKKGKK